MCEYPSFQPAASHCQLKLSTLNAALRVGEGGLQYVCTVEFTIIKCKRRGIRISYLSRPVPPPWPGGLRMAEVTCSREGGGWCPVIRADPCLCGRKEMQTGAKRRLRWTPLSELLTDKPVQLWQASPGHCLNDGLSAGRARRMDEVRGCTMTRHIAT